MSSNSRAAGRVHRPEPVPCVVSSPGGPVVSRRPGYCVPLIVIVIVVVLAVAGPPGQVVAALYALATVLSLLGFREALA